LNFEWDHIQSSSCLVPILYRSGLTYYYHTFFSACLPSHSSFPANKHICKIRTGSSPIKALNTGVIYKLRDFGRHRAGCHRWTRPDVKFMRADIATATQVSHIFLRREKLSPEKTTLVKFLLAAAAATTDIPYMFPHCEKVSRWKTLPWKFTVVTLCARLTRDVFAWSFIWTLYRRVRFSQSDCMINPSS